MKKLIALSVACLLAIGTFASTGHKTKQDAKAKTESKQAAKKDAKASKSTKDTTKKAEVKKADAKKAPASDKK